MSIAAEHLLEIREMVKDHLAHHEERRLTPQREEELKQQFRERLARENAAMVAHYYTADVVQDLAEETGGMVGDSLEMARFGTEHPGDTLVVAGVKFMGESAKILTPEKRVLMPTLEATCSLDLGCPIEEFSEFCDANPDREVVFLAVGFETTAPGNAMALKQAAAEGLTNFSEIVSHVLVPPAMEAILSSPTNRVQGFLAAGHVCAIMGWEEYEPIAEKYEVPIVPTGFEPVDILEGILKTVQLLESGEPGVQNQYLRLVREQGNPAARAVVDEVYEVCDRKWRGIGAIPGSGLRIRDELAAFDAEKKFAVTGIATEESAVCISGEILQGLKKPNECPAFGRECTPLTPLGATMVSSEGACAAYHKYSRKDLL